MTRIAHYLLLSVFAFALTLAGCLSEGDGTPSSTAPAADAAAEENRITFKADGETVRTTGHNIALSKMGGNVVLNITTSMHTDPRTINVNLAGTTVGRYDLVDGGAGIGGKSGGLYFPDYSNPGNAYTITGGEFNLTRVDTTAGVLEGTFSATARGADGKTVVITDGKIVKGSLAHGVVDVEAMMK